MSRKRRSDTKPAVAALPALPHSWPLGEWGERAPSVFPHTADRARHLIREHRDELIACGAITRIGRQIVVLAPGFSVFLARNAHRVADFRIAPNDPARRRAAAQGAGTPLAGADADDARHAEGEAA